MNNLNSCLSEFGFTEKHNTSLLVDPSIDSLLFIPYLMFPSNGNKTIIVSFREEVAKLKYLLKRRGIDLEKDKSVKIISGIDYLESSLHEQHPVTESTIRTYHKGSRIRKSDKSKEIDTSLCLLIKHLKSQIKPNTHLIIDGIESIMYQSPNYSPVHVLAFLLNIENAFSANRILYTISVQGQLAKEQKVVLNFLKSKANILLEVEKYKDSYSSEISGFLIARSTQPGELEETMFRMKFKAQIDGLVFS